MLQKSAFLSITHGGSVNRWSHLTNLLIHLYVTHSLSLSGKIPQGSGSTSANTNWKRDPPAGKLEPHSLTLKVVEPRRHRIWAELDLVNSKFLTDTHSHCRIRWMKTLKQLRCKQKHKQALNQRQSIYSVWVISESDSAGCSLDNNQDKDEDGLLVVGQDCFELLQTELGPASQQQLLWWQAQ